MEEPADHLDVRLRGERARCGAGWEPAGALHEGLPGQWRSIVSSRNVSATLGHWPPGRWSPHQLSGGFMAQVA